MQAEVTVFIKPQDSRKRAHREAEFVKSVLHFMHGPTQQKRAAWIYDVIKHKHKEGMDVEDAQAQSRYLVFTIN